MSVRNFRFGGHHVMVTPEHELAIGLPIGRGVDTPEEMALYFDASNERRFKRGRRFQTLGHGTSYLNSLQKLPPRYRGLARKVLGIS